MVSLAAPPAIFMIANVFYRAIFEVLESGLCLTFAYIPRPHSYN